MRSSVENFVQAFKGFLARSVPNLKLDGFVLDLDQEGAKLNSHSDFVVFFEVIFGQSHQHGGFSNAWG